MPILDIPRLLARLARRSRRRTRYREHRTATRLAPASDSWLEELHLHALDDARLAAAEVIEALAGHLGRWQQPRLVRMDVERGSLHLVLADGTAITLAVTRNESAEALCAALRLGGLHVRVSSPETGVLRLHAVWDHWHGVVEGIPATSPVSA